MPSGQEIEWVYSTLPDPHRGNLGIAINAIIISHLDIVITQRSTDGDLSTNVASTRFHRVL